MQHHLSIFSDACHARFSPIPTRHYPSGHWHARTRSHTTGCGGCYTGSCSRLRRPPVFLLYATAPNRTTQHRGKRYRLWFERRSPDFCRLGQYPRVLRGGARLTSSSSQSLYCTMGDMATSAPFM